MRKRFFLSSAVTVGLVLSLFVAAFSTAGAITGAVPTPGSTAGSQSALYFPWVHNGDKPGGVGPFYGTVTVQNLENFGINITLTTAGGKSTTAFLNPHASKTFSAALLGVADGGEGVRVDAVWASTAAGQSPCVQFVSQPIAYPGANTNIPLDAVNDFGAPAGSTISSIVSVNTVGGNTVNTSAYSVTGLGTGAATLTFNGQADLIKGTNFTVTALICPRMPFIGGVEKHMAPSLTTGTAQTTSANTIVDGYTTLSGWDLPQKNTGPGGTSSIYESYLPIVQTNNGWNSVLHLSNFGSSNAGVTLTFYQSFGQGAAGGSFGSFTQTMKSGSTWTFDLMDHGFPANWVGTVFISSDTQRVVTLVDRVKGATNMALTNVAAPRVMPQAGGPIREYAPLVFRDYNNWNTGINIANLSDGDNTISITYYNDISNVVAQDQITIPRRGMEYVYRPGIGADVDILRNHITSAVLTGTAMFHASVDEVKYSGSADFDQGQAMSYIATPYGAGAFAAAPGLSQLGLPLFQKGNMNGGGDTSGINLFNPSSNDGIQAGAVFYDESGNPVAPTLAPSFGVAPTPFPISLAAHESMTIYSLSAGGDQGNFSEMPQGFQGSVVITPTNSGPGGSGALVGVSNNVNYDVQFDGSAVYNLYATCGLFTFNPTCSGVQIVQVARIVLAADNGTTHTVGTAANLTATVYDPNNNVLAGVPVTLTVTGPNAQTMTVSTNNVGQAMFSYTGTKVGTDNVVASFGTTNSNTVNETWTAGPVAALALAPKTQTVLAGQAAGVVATVTDANGNPVAGAAVTFNVVCTNAAVANPATATVNTDANGQASFSFTATGQNAQTADCTVTATGPNGTTDTATVTFTLGKLVCTPGVTGSGSALCIATVVDNTGAPVAGQVVNFQVTSGTGTVSSNFQATDATGQTMPGVTVHGTSGTSVTVTAFIDTNANGTYEAGTDTLVGTSTVTLP